MGIRSSDTWPVTIETKEKGKGEHQFLKIDLRYYRVE